MTAQPVRDTVDTSLRDELLAVIRHAIRNQPRSQQTRIGPSELGHPCDRWLSHKLLNTEPVNARHSPWLPTIGTAVHAWLDDTFSLDNLPSIQAGDNPRWLLEQKVSVGTINDVDINGSCDLYDTLTATVVDWKTCGKTRLDKYRIHGPDPDYRVQAHAYGRGWTRRGRPVDTVAICFLPRNAELSGTIWWAEPYDEQIVISALARAQAISLANKALGTQAPAAMTTTDHNCFGGETRYLTPDGPRRFDETADTSQLVLTAHANPAARHREAASRSDGRWVEAEICSFGEQPLLRVTLNRNQVTKVIRATPGHRWMARPSNRDSTGPLRAYDTMGLKPGMVLPSLVPHSRIRQSLPATFGIAHGVIYGDGTRHAGQGSSVSLFGEKDLALLRYFNDSPTSPVKTPNGVEGITVNHLPRYFKSRPSLDESTAYLYGWLAGYFAADGSVSKVGMPKLCSANRGDLEFAQTVALRLGIPTYGITTEQRLGYGHLPSDMHSLVFVRSSLRPEFFLIREHRERFLAHPITYDRLRWRVESIEDIGEVEEVFCAVVPDTHTFALDDFVWTFNCGYCPWFAINAADLSKACPGDPRRPKPNDSVISLIAPKNK